MLSSYGFGTRPGQNLILEISSDILGVNKSIDLILGMQTMCGMFVICKDCWFSLFFKNKVQKGEINT